MLIDAIHDVPYIADPVEVGRGGFATVHRAMDLQADRPVAVKLLALGNGDGNLRYFDRERASLARLSTHPNVVTLHRTGVTTGGVPYLVMEFASGGSLADRLRADGPMAWDDAVKWLLPICDAIEHAHDQGIRHRDIKPQNILISAHGTPLLSDFGIAGQATGTETITQKAKLSLSYASPEQIEGRDLDNSTDVYSLGATLYTLIAGTPAFADTNGAGLLNTAKRILDERPAPLDDAVPTDIANAIAAAMAKNPSFRPTIGEFRRGLAQELTLDPPPPSDQLPDITREFDLPSRMGNDPILSSAASEWAKTLPGFDADEPHEEKPLGIAGLGTKRGKTLSVLAIVLLLLAGFVTAAWANRDGAAAEADTAAGEESSVLSPGTSQDITATDNNTSNSTSGGDEGTAVGSDNDGSADGDAGDASADTAPPTTTNPDSDGDGTLDVDDNCPGLSNPDQANRDGDASGDACDPDDDGDGVPDEQDNCRLDQNPTQEDVDNDSLGDACDDFPDRDGDGIVDTNDSCIEGPNAPDTDGDGTPDQCDSSPRGMAVVGVSAQIDRVTIINAGDEQPDMFGDLVVDGTKFALPEITDQTDIRPGNWVSDRVQVDPSAPLIQIRIWLRDEAGFCLFCKDDLVDITPAPGMNALHLVIDTKTGTVDLASDSWNRLETIGTLIGSDDGDLGGAILQIGDDDGVHRASIEVSITLAREPIA